MGITDSLGSSLQNSSSMAIMHRENELMMQTYKRLPVAIDRAEGMYIYTKEGERYLDFLGGIAVNGAGHSHPAIVRAVTEQMERYAHVSNFFYQDVQIDFADHLSRLSGYDRTFLCNSGTEATDGALKLARAWGAPGGKHRFISFTGGFHGRTYGALSLMDKPKYKEGMGPYLEGFDILPYNDPDALRRAATEDHCAIVLEYLQGEGGIVWATPEFVDTIEELREKLDILVIADEIQAGMGRTGRFFSFDHFDVRPDIVTTAKVLGGGLPLGALLGTDAVAAAWTSGRHGTTFGGNAVSCAAGRAMLQLLEEGVGENVRTVGEYLIAQLKELQQRHSDDIVDVRGAGAIIGVELAYPAADVIDRMLERHVIANVTNERVIRLLPPYIFTKDHTDTLVSALEASLGG